MKFHFSYERIVQRPPLSFNSGTRLLNSLEVDIIKQQIRKNAFVIDDYVSRLHLLLNVEKHKQDENFIDEIRQRMLLLMEENDTFRKVLWDHYLAEDALYYRNRG